MNERCVAAQVVVEVSQKGQSLDKAMTTVGRRTRADLYLFPRLREMVFGTLRWYGLLDALSRALLDRPLKAKDADLHALILVGLYQLREMRLPAHAAVDETVAAVMPLGKPWAKGLVNALLRRYQRQAEALIRDLNSDPAVLSAHPSWLVEKIKQAWPDRWEDILLANNRKPPMSLRVNRLRCKPQDYLETLKNSHIKASTSPHSPVAIILEKPLGVSALPGFEQGLVAVQDLAAQQATPLLDLKPGQRVLDACAAPGGKACHILETEPRLRELVALDVSANRLQKVQENLKRLGLKARLVEGDALEPQIWWDGEAFDRILLDAPCSGSGVIRRHPDIKLLRTPKDIEALAARQKNLLDSLWPLLRSGGKLVYATCSILPDEGENQLEWFMAKHPDTRALTTTMTMGVALKFGRQCIPGQAGMDGFYYAAVQKI
ncbi:MAG TPA: 16S rRNA (cytosine(967)-C(5))-methyltransferase RsmB [Acidiferrobacteraceae bacterium]|nr:16S rRNA (cytosine(967)-C(5))-methyltransferase RsmB [Acidiferrobacteraceae bacterium]